MGGYGRGLQFLKEQQERMGSRFGDRMQKLWLKNGESAKFAFVQDHTDIAVPLVHMVERKKRNGDSYNADVLCARRSMSEDPTVCQICMTEGSKGPWPRFVAIVWVDIIVHPTRKEGVSWVPVTVAGSTGTLYKEEVRDYRLLIMREKLTSQISAYLAGDPLDPTAPTPETILPIWWRYRVSGESAQKQELLEPSVAIGTPDKQGNPQAVDALLVEARKAAPVLDEVITAEFGPPQKATVAAGGGQSSDSDLVSYSPEEEAAAAMDDGATDSEDITF